tara:strand:+ start:1663 stop:3435 length:1773 start_codon:yes stop_codon:yes gene_type:complete
MKTVVFTFGRFNPPTVGHIKLAEKVKSVAKLNKADYKIYGSSSFDKKKNPLSPKIKERYMKKILRDKNAVVDSNVKTAFHAMKVLSDAGYEKIIMVVGSDRVAEFKKSISRYVGPGKDYDIKEFDVVSAGERDPEAEGVSGMSASKMRQAAKDGDLNSFKMGLPDYISKKDSEMMFKTLQKSMGIREHVDQSWFVYEEFDEFRETLYDLQEAGKISYVRDKHKIQKSNLLQQHKRERERMKIQHTRQKSRAKVQDTKVDPTDRLESVEDTELNELTVQQRLKMGRAARRTAKRRALKRKMKAKKMKGKEDIKKAANRAAILAVKNKILRGKNWVDLSPKDKERIELKVKKKTKVVKRLAKKLLPGVKKKEKERMKARLATEAVNKINQNSLAREKQVQYDKGSGVSTPKEKDAARKRAERKVNGSPENNQTPKEELPLSARPFNRIRPKTDKVVPLKVGGGTTPVMVSGISTQTVKNIKTEGEDPERRAARQAAWNNSKEQIMRRTARGAARRVAERKGMVKKGDGKDIHHKDGNPLNNSASNISVMNKSKNRGIGNNESVKTPQETDSSKREWGKKSLIDLYKKGTPGE